MTLTELPNPLYYSAHELAHVLHCEQPSNKIFYSAVMNAGYKVSQTHCNAKGFKTDAPSEVIWVTRSIIYMYLFSNFVYTFFHFFYKFSIFFIVFSG